MFPFKHYVSRAANKINFLFSKSDILKTADLGWGLESATSM